MSPLGGHPNIYRHLAPPPPEPPPSPPDYLGAETCAECWEPYGWALLPFLDHWSHRRKWGHNPTPLHPILTEPDLHAENVEGARRYRGYPPAPPVSRDPGRRLGRSGQ